MNVTVIKLKDLLKYLVVMGIVLITISLTTRFFNKKEKIDININIQDVTQKVEEKLENKTMKYIYSLIMPITNITEENNENMNKQNLNERILNINLGMIETTKIRTNNNESNIEDNQTNVSNEETEQENEITNNEKDSIELAKTDVNTQVVEENNITPSYTDTYQDIQIKNQSSNPVTEDLFAEQYEFKNTKEVLIYHTHTCESYTATEKYNYQMTGTYRTTDLNYSVARVGDELEKQLSEYGYNVTHDKTYHDYPAYNGSYDRSQETVKAILNNNPEIQTMIDLHRDAVGSSNEYAPSVLIGDESAAQLMMVIGTDGGGLWHPKWKQNFKLAVMIQQKANELYPGLFRPIILRDSRYNQHLTTGAMIIEVGATGNTMEQCLTSMKYLAKVMSEVIKLQ